MSTPVPKKLIVTMATRARRMHYYLWHEVRDYWLTYPKDVQKQLRDTGWEPPRPAWDEKGEPILANDSGEDFLYMHRQTIKYANKILADVGDPNYPRVEGWADLPPPENPDFPVPPVWFDPAEFDIVTRLVARAKTDIAFKKYFQFWEKMFKDPGFLTDISLGTLGSLLHSPFHDTGRRRWSAVPGGRRPDPGLQVTTIPVEWDDPRYDYFGDAYSMQVNPVYWKFYGWIDDRVEEWKVVHGVFGTDFWKGTWIGKMPAAGAGAPSGFHERLEDPEVAKRHAAEVEQMLLIIGRSVAAAM